MNKKHIVEITEKIQLCGDVFKFTVYAPELADVATPGQFLHISCSDDSTMLRRPISIYDIDKPGGSVSFIFQVRGHGTELLSRKKSGETVDMLAPLGKGFDLGDNYKNICVVGGGIGIFPLYSLIKHYPNAHKTAILGFSTSAKIVCSNEFCAQSDVFLLCTDDGSSGFNGTTAAALKQQLQTNDFPDVIFACGPAKMLKAIADIASNANIPCQVSLEERMACGIGACLVCACKTKKNSGWQHSHVCKDGPVFWADDVIWEN